MQLLHVQTLSGRGSLAPQFRDRLTGIAVDPADRLFVVGDREVKVFSPQGKFERQFETNAPGWSICADHRSVWVGVDGAVIQYDDTGQLVARIDDSDRLGLVTGLAVVGELLVVASATNRAIHVFDQHGQWRRELGADVNTRGFMLPNGVLDFALDAAGQSLVVAHPQKHRIERYTVDGTLLSKFGRFGMDDPADFGGCCNPTNVTVSRSGEIIVSEKAPPRVKVYSATGRFLYTSGETSFDANTKNIDLAADSADRLYATDPLRCTIEVFQMVRDNEGTP